MQHLIDCMHVTTTLLQLQCPVLSSPLIQAAGLGHDPGGEAATMDASRAVAHGAALCGNRFHVRKSKI